jgi:putative ABC transport system permease protein
MDLKSVIRDAFDAAGLHPAEAVIEELAEHAADLERDALANGLSAPAARRVLDEHIAVWVRDTPRRPPSVERHIAGAPAAGRIAWLASDVRYALRMFARQPAPATVGVATIALAIAAVAVMSALVWRVAYQPLPWPESDRLVRIYEGRRGGSAAFGQFGAIVTNGSYLAWQQSPSTIEGIGAWSHGERTLSGDGPAERVVTTSVSPSLLAILRAGPAAGRVFREGDTLPASPPVAVISDVFWRQRLGGRRDVVGSVVRLDGEPVTIVGVMPPGFAFPDSRTLVWLPLRVPPTVTPGSRSGNIRMFNAMARLAPGVSIEQAAAEAVARAQAAPQAGPVALAVFGSDGPAEMRLVPALDDQVGEIRPALLVLLAAVGLLLLASAGNVANVQLARSMARRRELAIRAALGAAPGRLAAQLLVESLTLGIIGGLAGLGLAVMAAAALPAILPADFPRLDQIAMDWRGAIAAMAGALLAGGVAGLIPAWHARRSLTAGALAEDGQSAVGLSHGSAAGRIRTAVMAAQVAIATVLLVGSTLLGRSFIALLETDRGFDTRQVLTAALPVPNDPDGTRRRSILDRTVERLEGIPGVAAVGYTSILPLSDSESMRAFEMPGPDGQPRTVRTSFRIVSSGYFKAMGMRATSGRVIGRVDTSSSRPVCVVNEAFVRAYLDASPLDTDIPVARDNEAGFTLVGVVADVRSGDATPVGPELFVAQEQWPDKGIGGDPMIAVRTVGASVELAPLLRSIVADIDPTLAVSRIATMEERVAEQLAKPRLYSMLMTVFAVLAVSIAAVGLFGVLSFSVAQRARELAVRSALGASPGALLRLVLRHGVAVTLSGVGLGVFASLALVGTLRQWLYGLTGTEPVTYVGVGLLMLAVAVAACAAPALRAARLDPLVVLKRG